MAAMKMTEALPLPITALLVPVLGSALGLTTLSARLRTQLLSPPDESPSRR